MTDPLTNNQHMKTSQLQQQMASSLLRLDENGTEMDTFIIYKIPQ